MCSGVSTNADRNNGVVAGDGYMNLCEKKSTGHVFVLDHVTQCYRVLKMSYFWIINPGQALGAITTKRTV